MNLRAICRPLAAIWLSLLLAACGGGESDGASAGPGETAQAYSGESLSRAEASALAAVRPVPGNLWQPAQGRTPRHGNYVYLESQEGDFIGQGRNYLYTQADAVLRPNAAGGSLSMLAHGDERWTGDFQLPAAFTRLRRGYFPDVLPFPYVEPDRASLDWMGEARACGFLTGWLAIDAVEYEHGRLVAFDLRFEQHCEGQDPALRGKIHWSMRDTTTPPGPVNPPPSSLWKAPAGSVPASGNYVYLQSDAGDYMGGGRNYLYTQREAQFALTPQDLRLILNVTGDETWRGEFMGMNSISMLQPGYYGGLREVPNANPAKGGLEWSGNGNSCWPLSGWFVIDKVTYTASGALAAVDLRFEQHCWGSAAALRGQVHWEASDTTSPPGPVNPPPAGLWQPATGSTPTSGNYVYLQSDSGDYVGGGNAYLYAGSNAVLSVGAPGALAMVSIVGNETWTGQFQGMSSITQLQPGYYGGLKRYPFNNPARGGLSWTGEGRACNTLSGWFVVDSVSFVNGALTALDLRFEQHCEGGAPALRGKVHWNVNDVPPPPGPVLPPPEGLWQPAAGSTPASGNYLVLQSDAGDYVGGGNSYSYTHANALFTLSVSEAYLQVSMDGAQSWLGRFQGMRGLTALKPGYYGNLKQYPMYNPLAGGMDWSGESRICGDLSGWFVIDSIAYSGASLSSVELRFEQHCHGGGPALRGKLRWAASDVTPPPGPVLPVPTGLWSAPGSALPASGNYVYLSSDAGDWLGAGQASLLYSTGAVNVVDSGRSLSVQVGNLEWNGIFTPMQVLAHLQPGYYGNVSGSFFGNPISGGVFWSGQGRACNRITGWFAVDGVTYDGTGAVSALDVRFEQHCEGQVPALRGQVHWVR
jgi:hypothetical protein